MEGGDILDSLARVKFYHFCNRRACDRATKGHNKCRKFSVEEYDRIYWLTYRLLTLPYVVHVPSVEGMHFVRPLESSVSNRPALVERPRNCWIVAGVGRKRAREGGLVE